MNTDEHGFKYQEITEKIIGAFYAAYNELGHGFLESVYQSALAVELRSSGLVTEREAPIPVYYRGQVIGQFRADILVEGKIVVEVKAARNLEKAHEAQILNYLKATACEIGLLLNFGPRPAIRRFVFDNAKKKIRVHPCSSVASLSL